MLDNKGEGKRGRSITTVVVMMVLDGISSKGSPQR